MLGITTRVCSHCIPTTTSSALSLLVTVQLSCTLFLWIFDQESVASNSEIESDLGDLGRYSKNEKKANVEYIIGVIFNLVLYNSLKNSIVPIHK